MKTITISSTDIDIHDDKLVGISLSGGADSAVLLYILLKHLTQPVHIYTFLSEAKKAVAEPVVDRVIEKCVELSGNTNIVHHKEYIDAQTPALIYGIMADRIREKEVDIIYTGMTKFPPDDVINTFNEKLESWLYENRKFSETRPLYFGNDRFYRPFMNIDKKDIFELYSSLDLLEPLYPLTRSCENTDSPLQHCGKCFWCEERHWGFGYLE
jgi:7-cyano-7-deazaguanine synthase in queuosine biosynthesis